jgi:uncharacterized protein (TIRG00374 family)
MVSSDTGKNVRRALLLVLFIGFTALVASRFTDAKKLVSTLSQGEWEWVVLGTIVHIIYFIFYAVLYQLGFSTIGIKSSLLELVPVVFASVFINAVAPLGGAGGAALFINHNVQRGQSGARTTVGLALVVLADLATLIPFIFFGITFLSINHQLKFYETLSGLIYVFFVLGLTSLLVMSRWWPKLLRNLLDWAQRFVNWIGKLFKHPDILDEVWVEHNINEFREGTKAILAHPKMFSITLLWGLFLHIVNLIGLYIFFLAFHQPVQLGTLVAGFGLGIVFFIITILPEGVGAVEGVMTLVFISMGIPKTNAIIIALSFRGVNFWLPLVIGLIALQSVTSEPPTNKEAPANPEEAQS